MRTAHGQLSDGDDRGRVPRRHSGADDVGRDEPLFCPDGRREPVPLERAMATNLRPGEFRDRHGAFIDPGTPGSARRAGMTGTSTACGRHARSVPRPCRRRGRAARGGCRRSARPRRAAADAGPLQYAAVVVMILPSRTPSAITAAVSSQRRPAASAVSELPGSQGSSRRRNSTSARYTFPTPAITF